MYRKILIMILVVSVSLAGCGKNFGSAVNSSNEGKDKIENSDSGSSKSGFKLTIEDIKKDCKEPFVVQNIYTYKEYYVLVQYHIDNASDQFEFINLKTGDRDFLPKGCDFASFLSFDNENKINLYDSGSNSESDNKVFPFIISCERKSEDINKQNDFEAVNKEVYLPLDRHVTLGTFKPEQITDINIEKQSIKVTYGPIPGKEVEFYADSCAPAETIVNFDKASGMLVMEVIQSTMSKGLENKLQQMKSDSIKSITAKQQGQNLKLFIKLDESLKEYTGICKGQDSGSDIPSITVTFR